jgi:hypothetical protein
MAIFSDDEVAGLQSAYEKNRNKKKKVSSRGGTATSLISEGGATGGAIGGAALGTALLPGIGTVLGAGIGGLVGGLGGSAAEQKVRDDKVNWKKAAAEGVISGATGAIAPGGALVKGSLKGGSRAVSKKRATDPIMSGVDQVAQERQIPVKFLDDTNITGGGVPIKQTANKTLTNPTLSDMELASSQLASQGYKVSSKVGSTSGRKSTPGGGASLFQPAPKQSVVQMQGTRTKIPVASGNGYERSQQAVSRAIPEAAQASTQVVKTAAQNTPSLLSKFSRNATRSGSGLKTGGGVGDINRVDDAVEVLNRYKISGTPTKQLRQVDETMGKLGGQVDDILSKSPVPLSGANVRASVQKAVDDPLKYADLDLTTTGAQRNLQAHLNKFEGATSAKEINDYIKTLNPIAKRAQDKIARGVALTDKEAAVLAAKRAGDDVLSEIPEIRSFKRDMAILFERNPEITKLSEESVGIPILGVKSRALKQATVGAQSKIGQVTARNSDKVTSGTIMDKFRNRSATINPGIAQVGGSIVANQVVPDEAAGENIATPEDTVLIDDTTDIAEPISPYPRENFLADIKRDPENAKKYAELYEMYAMASGGGAAEKPLSAEASKIISNAQTGIQAIDDFENAIAEDPSVLAKRVIPGRGAFGGAVGGVLGTSGADAAAQQIIDVIARLRTGAAITNDEAKRFERFIPQAADPERVRQQKLGYLRNQFQMVANRSGTAGTDVESAVGL